MNNLTKNSIIFFLHRSTFFLFIFPVVLTYKSNSMLIITLNMIFTYILIYLFKYIKNNKIINIIINIILSIFSIYMLTLLVNFVKFEYLKKTNNIYIYLLFIFSIIYIASKKIDSIHKLSFIMFILSILLFFLQTTQLSFSFEISNVKITNKINFLTILINSFKLSLFSAIPFITVKENKKIRIYYLISSITIIATSILVFNILESNLLYTYKYPLFNLLSYINIFGFMNRLESIFSLMLITDIILCCIYTIHYIKSKVHIIHKSHI